MAISDIRISVNTVQGSHASSDAYVTIENNALRACY